VFSAIDLNGASPKGRGKLFHFWSQVVIVMDGLLIALLRVFSFDRYNFERQALGILPNAETWALRFGSALAKIAA